MSIVVLDGVVKLFSKDCGFLLVGLLCCFAIDLAIAVAPHPPVRTCGQCVDVKLCWIASNVRSLCCASAVKSLRDTDLLFDGCFFRSHKTSASHILRGLRDFSYGKHKNLCVEHWQKVVHAICTTFIFMIFCKSLILLTLLIILVGGTSFELVTPAV